MVSEEKRRAMRRYGERISKLSKGSFRHSNQVSILRERTIHSKRTETNNNSLSRCKASSLYSLGLMMIRLMRRYSDMVLSDIWKGSETHRLLGWFVILNDRDSKHDSKPSLLTLRYALFASRW